MGLYQPGVGLPGSRVHKVHLGVWLVHSVNVARESPRQRLPSVLSFKMLDEPPLIVNARWLLGGISDCVFSVFTDRLTTNSFTESEAILHKPRRITSYVQ